MHRLERKTFRKAERTLTDVERTLKERKLEEHEDTENPFRQSWTLLNWKKQLPLPLARVNLFDHMNVLFLHSDVSYLSSNPVYLHLIFIVLTSFAYKGFKEW